LYKWPSYNATYLITRGWVWQNLCR